MTISPRVPSGTPTLDNLGAPPSPECFLSFIECFRDIAGWSALTPTRYSNDALAAAAGVNHKWLSRRTAAAARGETPYYAMTDVLFPLLVTAAVARMAPRLRKPSILHTYLESFHAAYPDHPASFLVASTLSELTQRHAAAA